MYLNILYTVKWFSLQKLAKIGVILLIEYDITSHLINFACDFKAQHYTNKKGVLNVSKNISEPRKRRAILTPSNYITLDQLIVYIVEHIWVLFFLQYSLNYAACNGSARNKCSFIRISFTQTIGYIVLIPNSLMFHMSFHAESRHAV